jgi:hypothetical protein
LKLLGLAGFSEGGMPKGFSNSSRVRGLETSLLQEKRPKKIIKHTRVNIKQDSHFTLYI